MKPQINLTDNQKRLNKIFILMDMQIQEIDTITEKKMPAMENIADKLIELQDLLIPVFEQVYENNSVKRTNFFQTLQQKFHYNMDSEIKRYNSKNRKA